MYERCIELAPHALAGPLAVFRCSPSVRRKMQAAFSVLQCSLFRASARCLELLMYSSASSVFVSFFCIRERVLYLRASSVFVSMCCVRERVVFVSACCVQMFVFLSEKATQKFWPASLGLIISHLGGLVLHVWSLLLAVGRFCHVRALVLLS